MTLTQYQEIAKVKADIETEKYMLMYYSNKRAARQDFNKTFAFYYVVFLNHLRSFKS